MIIERPFIFYSLPKSRTTQQLNGGRKIEKAWENICSFLDNCTTTKIDKPTSISLTVYSAFQGDPNPEIAEKIIQETKCLFHIGETIPIAYSYPNGIPDKQTKTEWQLDVNDLQKALDYLINGQPWPKFTFGPIELLVTFYFKLVDPKTKAELKNQEEKSSLMVWLSRNCVCSPDFYFSFEAADQEFYQYLQSIESYLPFKLEEKYLRLGRPNKSKTRFTFTKLKTD